MLSSRVGVPVDRGCLPQKVRLHRDQNGVGEGRTREVWAGDGAQKRVDQAHEGVGSTAVHTES